MICCSRHGLTNFFYKESDSKYFQDLLTILIVVGQYTVATTQLYQCSVKDTKRFVIHKEMSITVFQQILFTKLVYAHWKFSS